MNVIETQLLRARTEAQPEIASAWDAARDEFEWGDYSALLRSGIDKRLLAAIYNDIGFGAADIAVKNGKWSRMFRGERAIVVPVENPARDLIDLVAFRIDTPKSFWPLLGNAAMLGESEIDRAAGGEVPLQMHECPLDWLRAGREGCVVISWARYWPLYLTGVPALKFESRAYASRVTALMARPLPVPPILVPAS